MTDLPTRVLGRTGVSVSALGFGTFELRDATHRTPRPLPPGQAARILHAVLDAGITVIDTSIDYGESEATIGRSIAHRRDEYFLASKCGCPLDPRVSVDSRPGPLPHDFSPATIIGGVDASLRRLRTDHLDLVQLHHAPSLPVLVHHDVPATLERLRRDGKVRFVGATAGRPEIVDLIRSGLFDAFQIRYSALDQHHLDVITMAAEAGAGVIVSGGVARGAHGQGHGDATTWARFTSCGLDDLRGDDSPTQFMLRYTMSNPHMATTVVGTARLDHLADNVAAASKGRLDPETYAEAQRRLQPHPPR